MNCVLFAKIDQVFSSKSKTIKHTANGGKYYKSRIILSVRKRGNHAYSKDSLFEKGEEK